jgi:transcriptional regulator with XRE-family HTH domain
MIGKFIREQREFLKTQDKCYSLRQFAARLGVQPSYLSAVERGEGSPPSEAFITKVAHNLNLDADVLLAMTGRVSNELQNIICSRPALFAQIIRELKDTPEDAVLRLVREVSDGAW